MRKHEERECVRTLLPSVVLIETSYISATTALQRKLIYRAVARKGVGGFIRWAVAHL